MYSSTAKKALLLLSLFLFVSLACDMTVTVTAPTSPASVPANTLVAEPVTPIPATLASIATATSLVPSLEGVEITVDRLRIVLSPGLASGARGLQFQRAEGAEVAPWEITPGHIQLRLEGYILQNALHEPQIYVYPAQGYAELFPAAFESMDRLNSFLNDPAAPVNSDELPYVPFFNAAQVFASNIQIVSFQNGRGVRFLTEYAQYAAPVNNNELFYHFQGLTSDGAYYIVAILPISSRMLAENSDAAAVLPPGGIPYPDIADPNADFQGYYNAVTALLNAASPEAFTPTTQQLDRLVQSIRINP